MPRPLPVSQALFLLGASGALIACAAALPAGALAQDSGKSATETARGALARLEQEEASVPAGRLTLGITERRGKYQARERPEETRARLEREPAHEATGTVLFSPAGWRRETAASGTSPAGGPSRTWASEARGTFRTLAEATLDGARRRIGRVSPSGTTPPGDAVLTRRSARALAGVQWTEARSIGDRLLLEGRRGEERHYVSLQQGEPVRLLSWRLNRPDDEGGASYVVEVTPPSSQGESTRVEEWAYNPTSPGSAGYRRTIVLRVETTPAARPEELEVRFPQGTELTDLRGGEPVLYELLREEPAGAPAPPVGRPAPELALPDLGGKTFRLASLRGMVVVLAWFSPTSAPSDETAEALSELHEAWRKKGVQVVAVAAPRTVRTPAGELRASAEAFRHKHEWSFPVLIDEDAAVLRRYSPAPAAPSVALVDRRGTLFAVFPGIPLDALDSVLERLTDR